jgi:predicted dinucleotide-binding enzyme
LLARALVDEGFQVLIADPQAARAATDALAGQVEEVTAEEAARQADVIVVTTPWPEFAAIDLAAFRRPTGRASVIDPWRLFEVRVVGEVADLIYLGQGLPARTAV